LKQLQDNFRCI